MLTAATIFVASFICVFVFVFRLSPPLPVGIDMVGFHTSTGMFSAHLQHVLCQLDTLSFKGVKTFFNNF